MISKCPVHREIAWINSRNCDVQLSVSSLLHALQHVKIA